MHLFGGGSAHWQIRDLVSEQEHALERHGTYCERLNSVNVVCSTRDVTLDRDSAQLYPSSSML